MSGYPQQSPPARKGIGGAIALTVLITIVVIALGLYGVYRYTASQAQTYASLEDFAGHAAPSSSAADRSYLLPGGTDLPVTYGSCSSDARSQLAASGTMANPRVDLTLQNNFSGPASGRLFVTGLQAIPVSTTAATPFSTEVDCYSDEDSVERDLSVDLDHGTRFIRFDAFTSKPSTATGDPTFSIAPGKAISISV